YLDHGFIHAQIEPPKVSLTRDKRWIEIAIKIIEGDQYKLSQVGLKGDLPTEGKIPIPADVTVEKRRKLERQQHELEDLLGSKAKDYFSRSQIGQDIVRLTERYADEGYAFANIYPLTDVDENKKTVTLNYDVQKGQKGFIE